jgi:hypothetical protein
MSSRVEIVERPGGGWGWRFIEGDYVLESNHDYQSRADAERAAGVAYPEGTIEAGPSVDHKPERIGLLRFLLIMLVIWRRTRKTRAG